MFIYLIAQLFKAKEGKSTTNHMNGIMLCIDIISECLPIYCTYIINDKTTLTDKVTTKA